MRVIETKICFPGISDSVVSEAANKSMNDAPAAFCKVVVAAADLYILATLACIWMYHDNKSRGKSFASVIPYLLITGIFVSIGPLLYLVVKGFSKQGGAAKT